MAPASPENRKEAVKILSAPNYVGADEAVIANSMIGERASVTGRALDLSLGDDATAG